MAGLRLRELLERGEEATGKRGLWRGDNLSPRPQGCFGGGPTHTSPRAIRQLGAKSSQASPGPIPCLPAYSPAAQTSLPLGPSRAPSPGPMSECMREGKVLLPQLSPGDYHPKS